MFGEDAKTAGAVAAGGAPGGAVRLDKGTYSDRAKGARHVPRVYRGFRAKLIHYGEGLAECAFAFIGDVPRTRGIRGVSENADENEKRAIRRARTRVRQLVLSGGLDHLLTLTYRANVVDYAQASGDLAKFERKVRTKYHAFRFVAVPERQKRGAWHWHLAVPGWQDVAFLRQTWRSIVGDGNIDVEPPRHGLKDQRLGLVRYLAKYLAKGFGEGRTLNRHRFRASRGIDIPVECVRLGVRSSAGALEAVRKLVERSCGSVGAHFVNDEYGSGVVFSWEWCRG